MSKRKRTPNDPPPLSEEHQRHQKLFKERQALAGFLRWMASRYRGVVPTTPGKPHKRLES